MTEWRVILNRGPKPSKTWVHTTWKRAWNQVNALEDLHSCDSTISDDGKTITVNADNWYTKLGA